jgi:hypothetical protein
LNSPCAIWQALSFSPRGAIHQFIPEVMPEIMPTALSMKIMPAFPFELHCVLALFSCQHVWYIGLEKHAETRSCSLEFYVDTISL